MGWIEIPLGLAIVAIETGPLTEVADPFPKIVVTLSTDLYILEFFNFFYWELAYNTYN